MASGNVDHNALTTGQSISVLIEHSTPNIVSVNFSCDGKIYRGVLLAENERIGVNETRSTSSESWPPLPTETGSVFSLKSPACAVERFTYKSEGEPSRLSVLRPTNKRPLSYRSSIFPSRSPPQPHSQSPTVFRQPNSKSTSQNLLCHNCGKSLVSSNSNSSDSAHERASTRSSKRGHHLDDSLAEVKLVSSVKRRRLEEPDKNDHGKAKKLKYTDEASQSSPLRKRIETTQELLPSVSAPHIPMKRQKDNVLTFRPKDLIKHQTDSLTCKFPKTDEDFSASEHRKSTHERSRHRERHVQSKRSTGSHPSGSSKEAGLHHPGVSEKNEPEKPVPEPYRPPIKIKINRALISGDGESEFDQSKGSDMLSEYKVEVVHDVPEASTDGPVSSLNQQNSPSLSNKDPSATGPPSSNSPQSEVEPISPQRSSAPPIDERPVKRYRLPSDPSITFRIDDVVWCKLSGWPWWPARIISLHRSASSCMACVRWVAWNQISHFPCDKIFPFLVEDDRKVDKRRMKKQAAYKKAIEEALEMARARAAQISDDEDESIFTDDMFDLSNITFSTAENRSSPNLKAARDDNERKVMPAVNGFPIVIPPDDSGNEFGGGGPLMIVHVPTPPKALEGEVADSRVFFSTPTRSCSILR